MGNQLIPPSPPQIPWVVGLGSHSGKCVPGSHGAERQRGAGGSLAQVEPSSFGGVVRRDIFP